MKNDYGGGFGCIPLLNLGTLPIWPEGGGISMAVMRN